MVREMGPAKACGDHVPLLHSLRLSKQRGGRIFLSKQRGSQNRESLSCKARPLGSAVSQNREALKTERCGEGELREFASQGREESLLHSFSKQRGRKRGSQNGEAPWKSQNREEVSKQRWKEGRLSKQGGFHCCGCFARRLEGDQLKPT